VSFPSRSLSRLFLAVICASLFLGGCAIPYKPVSVDLSPVMEERQGERFFNILVEHLDHMRNYPFARLFRRGEYSFKGVQLTEDGRQAVYLFEAENPENLAHIPMLRYSYIYFDFRGTPRLIAQENTSTGQDSTNDGDGPFKGTFKLTILGARYCSGDTKDLPLVEGNHVRIVQYSKLYLRSLKQKMQKYFTPTYCQGFNVPPDMPGLAGVRFYFDTKSEMDEFASALVAAFPFIGTGTQKQENR
jgi:hypothetical protein